MSFSGMLPLPFATVDIAPVGEQLIAVGGLVVAGWGRSGPPGRGRPRSRCPFPCAAARRAATRVAEAPRRARRRGESPPAPLKAAPRLSA